MRTWTPPSLNERVSIVFTDGTQIMVWAHRFDRRSTISFEEGLDTIFSLSTEWTIRQDRNINLDAGFQIQQNGNVYDSIGPPQERGGGPRNNGYWLITTQLRE